MLNRFDSSLNCAIAAGAAQILRDHGCFGVVSCCENTASASDLMQFGSGYADCLILLDGGGRRELGKFVGVEVYA